MNHKLTNRDVENKTADCSICGPNTKMAVKVRGNGKMYFQCQVVRNRHRRNSRKKSWGELHSEEKQLIFDNQEGKCAICLNDLTEAEAKLDHCHKRLVSRGILCHSCNILLGMAKDNIEILTRAIKYLNDSF